MIKARTPSALNRAAVIKPLRRWSLCSARTISYDSLLSTTDDDHFGVPILKLMVG